MSTPQGNSNDPYQNNDPFAPRYDAPEEGNYSFNAQEGTEYGAYSSEPQHGTPSYQSQSEPQFGAPASHGEQAFEARSYQGQSEPQFGTPSYQSQSEPQFGTPSYQSQSEPTFNAPEHNQAPQFGAPAFQPLNSQGPQPYQSQFIPQPEKKSGVWKWILGGCLALLVLGLLAGCLGFAGLVSAASHSDSSSSSSTTDSSTSTTTEESTEGKNPGVELKVISAGPRAAEVGKGSFKETAQGEFLPVKFEISNKSDAQIFVLQNDLKLIGEDGTVYGPTASVYELENGDKAFMSAQINPGLSDAGILVFDIPKGVKIKEIKFTELGKNYSVTAPITE